MNVIKKLFLITLSLLTGVVGTSSQAYASLTSQPWQWCHGLNVYVSGQILGQYTAVGSPVMTHGDYIDCRKEAGVCDRYIFEQSTSYGPDATLTFKNKTTGKLVKIEVQQNFCFLEAGNITVTPLQGKWEYNSHNGSYTQYDGTVNLIAVSDQ